MDTPLRQLRRLSRGERLALSVTCGATSPGVRGLSRSAKGKGSPFGRAPRSGERARRANFGLKNERNVNCTLHWYFSRIFKGFRALFSFFRGYRGADFCIYCTKYRLKSAILLERRFTYFHCGMLYNADVDWVGRQAQAAKKPSAAERNQAKRRNEKKKIHGRSSEGDVQILP